MMDTSEQKLRKFISKLRNPNYLFDGFAREDLAQTLEQIMYDENMLRIIVENMRPWLDHDPIVPGKMIVPIYAEIEAYAKKIVDALKEAGYKIKK